jgi:hypothetical protein
MIKTDLINRAGVGTRRSLRASALLVVRGMRSLDGHLRIARRILTALLLVLQWHKRICKTSNLKGMGKRKKRSASAPHNKCERPPLWVAAVVL